VCTVLIELLVKYMCFNNINNYLWSLIYFIGLIFMLSVASAYSAFKFYGYIHIVFVLVLSYSVATPLNLLLSFWGVTVGIRA
jgi:hypothetical protein